VLIVDGHLDLAWNALQWNRDLTRTVAELRAAPYVEVPLVAGQGLRGDIVPTVSLPAMRQGRVGLCFATLLARSTGSPVPYTDYASPLQAHGVAHGQLAYYRALEGQGWMRMIRDAPALDAHVAAWEAFDRSPAGASPPPVGFVLAAEGVDFILEPSGLADWHAAGLRALSLSHFGPGRYAGGTGTDAGVSPRGPALLGEMRRLGLILDASHLSDRAFREALDHWDGPVMASHNNCRALVPAPRQFSDDQVRELVRRDGVIGTAFDAWMLVPGWVRGGTVNPTVTMEAVADQIDHVCQLAGDVRHAAIGSDLDGGFGREQSPVGLDTIADVQKLGGMLRRRGHADADVAAIFHGNWLALLRRAWRG
jgi:membrane dipeptidase